MPLGKLGQRFRHNRSKCDRRRPRLAAVGHVPTWPSRTPHQTAEKLANLAIVISSQIVVWPTICGSGWARLAQRFVALARLPNDLWLSANTGPHWPILSP